MDSDVQRLYSVLTKIEVREKMTKEIDQISEVFSLSKSDATVILTRLRWNSFQASDRLVDDKEKLLAELGLIQVSDSNQNESNSSTYSNGDDDYFVSTPFCSHKFSTTCWTHYLSKTLMNNNKNEDKVLISCLNHNCVASVGPDTINQLTEPVKEMYESYLLESFVENNKESIKWCPASGCDYAIERHEEVEDDESNGFGVVCLCGHTFCWSCRLETHRPVTCNNASLWLTKISDHSNRITWIDDTVKNCPTCNSLGQNTGYRYVTCICRCTFCWICLRPPIEHNGKWNCIEVSFPPSKNDHTLSRHMNLWETSNEELVKAKSDLKAIEEKNIPKLTVNLGLTEQDTRALREAWMLIVQCKQVLKWSFVFDYFITDYQSAKKQYLTHVREKAITIVLKHKETLDELMSGAISAADITFFKFKLETSTTNTGNYFHYFVKTLEDGLSEVKVDAYEHAPTSCWFCDRCTFQNDWSDKECTMCFVSDDSSSPPHVAFGNNNTASAHHQQVPNDPLVREGEANNWKFD